MLNSLRLKQVEGLLVEQNMSSCYELITKYIGCILDHVKDLSKQRYGTKKILYFVPFYFKIDLSVTFAFSCPQGVSRSLS